VPVSRRGDGDPRRRRALTHVGGPVEQSGDAAAAAVLADALDVQSSLEDEERARAHVHGFHSYPARMHPVTARRLCEGFCERGATLLDPFCGSGTVLVEARLAGRRALGVDANPLAVRLARLKVRGVPADERRVLQEAAERVAAVATERRKAKSGASRRYGPEDVALFEPHVLLELDSLRVGLDGLSPPALREDLELVLSSLLTKVSRRAADTSEHAAPRRIAAGYPSRLLVKKTEELCRLLAEIEPQLRSAPPPRVVEGDARRLREASVRDVDLVVTSPPYPGVYDYLAHHAARLRWLRLSHLSFDAAEIGARRRLEPLGPAEGRRAWERELGAVLGSIRSVLRSDARVVLLIADSVVAGVAVGALEALTRAAREASLSIAASASQGRPHFHGPTAKAFRRAERREHAVLLTVMR
jgi:16S rRNA G966 N2-methylase RsmD